MENFIVCNRTKKKYREKCAVKHCGSRTDKNVNLSFFSFPRQNTSFVLMENYVGKVERIDRADAWKRATKVKLVRTKAKVCSLHFKQEDYILPGAPTKRKVLKKTAVPSCNLPDILINEEKLQKKEQRSERCQKRNSQKEILSEKNCGHKLNNEQSAIIEEQNVNNGPDVLEVGVEDIVHVTSVKEIGVQVKSGEFMQRFSYPILPYKYNLLVADTVPKMSALEYPQDIVGEKYQTYKDMHYCNLCPYMTKALFLILNHVKRHRLQHKTFSCEKSAPETYHCKYCDFKADLLIFLKKHIQEIHRIKSGDGESQIVENTLESFVCQNCTFETYSSLQWLQHFKIGCPSTQEAHHEETDGQKYKHYHCKYCPFKTKYKDYLRKHEIYQHKHDEEIHFFQCDYCEHTTKWKDHLTSHVRCRHTELKDTDLFHCNNCSYKTKIKSYLKNHNMRRHLTSEEIHWSHCDKCSFKTKTKYQLRNHTMRVHLTSEEIQWFQCDKCSFKTKTKIQLGRHNTRIHVTPEEIQWLHCDKCSFKTKTKNQLRNHSRRIHIAPAEIHWSHCDKCSYKTKTKEELRKHNQRIHLKSELKCDKCPFKTETKDQLRYHYIRIHLIWQKLKIRTK